VDLDHQAFLGDTVAKIAREKVGIARPEKPFILGNQAHHEVNDIVKEAVEDIGGLLFPPVLVEKDIDHNDGGFSLLSSQKFPATVSGQRIIAHMPCFPSATPLRASLPLHGAHQLDNLATALGVLNALLTRDLDVAHQPLQFNSRITPETIQAGIEATSWPGRLSFHTIAIRAQEANRVDTLLVLADGAHNPASAETLGAYIKSLLEATHPSPAPPAKPLPITYVLGLSHSPPKTPLQTLGPLLSPLRPSDGTSSTLDVRPGVALLPFTPPEGMPWVQPVPTPSMRAAVRSLLPGLAERDIWTPVDAGAEAPGDRDRNRALADALRWAAGRHAALVGDGEDGERMPGLVILAGSLYLVADFYRLIEAGTLSA
jgi:folylpolyglutamate synthase/dihydropteroate synthase